MAIDFIEIFSAAIICAAGGVALFEVLRRLEVRRTSARADAGEIFGRVGDGIPVGAAVEQARAKAQALTRPWPWIEGNAVQDTLMPPVEPFASLAADQMVGLPRRGHVVRVDVRYFDVIPDTENGAPVVFPVPEVVQDLDAKMRP
ncbi:MAG TPA: hypothetical protein VI756_18995 [Blastocatellia bacterium]